MHQYWLCAGRYYQLTEDEYSIYGDPASKWLSAGTVVLCQKIVETKFLGRCAAIFEIYQTGEIISYNLKNRPERINFVAIHPDTLGV